MKNQYFGDIHDYRKYGILRILAQDARMPLCICWMLTPDDSRGDGRSTSYLHKPERWRRFDPRLFDSLRATVVTMRSRTIETMERSRLIAHSSYVSEILQDTLQERGAFFDRLARTADSAGLIFFDQDNGMEVNSVAKGRKNSRKYLYWDEAQRLFKDGKSLLLYQHYPRIKRTEYHRRIIASVRSTFGDVHGSIFITSRVAFFLVLQRRHEKRFQRAIENIAAQWRGEIRVRSFQSRVSETHWICSSDLYRLSRGVRTYLPARTHGMRVPVVRAVGSHRGDPLSGHIDIPPQWLAVGTFL